MPYSFQSDSRGHADHLRELEGLAEQTYLCNRPPRPSGARLICVEYGTVLNGWVRPTDGSPSCKDEGCMMVDGHCVRNIHAEVDALLLAAKHGYSTKHATLYSINKPCYNCTIAAIKAGVKVIYYAYAVYDEERTREALEAAGVTCTHVPI